MRVFISQPMRDKTDEQIQIERERAINNIKKTFPNKEFEFIDTIIKDAPEDAHPLWYLGESFKLLSTADIAYFVRGWEDYRGCKMEHKAATKYGIMCIIEN